MQTFLPYRSFERSARVLDNRRLGKQRIEAKQIYLAITNPDYGWQHHPAVNMWRGHPFVLCLYGAAMCKEWMRRGFKDQQLQFFDEQRVALFFRACDALIETDEAFFRKLMAPAWLGDHAFHRSHQSNLLRKDPIYYRHQFPKVPDNLPYIWP